MILRADPAFLATIALAGCSVRGIAGRSCAWRAYTVPFILAILGAVLVITYVPGLALLGAP